MADEITISFDGVEVKTQAGKMVLEAAIEAGVFIPYLCYHPGMKTFAACRMCVVGVEGGRGFPAACALPVQDGMKIRNEVDDVQAEGLTPEELKAVNRTGPLLLTGLKLTLPTPASPWRTWSCITGWCDRESYGATWHCI